MRHVLVLAVLMGCGSDARLPDGSWLVTVTGLETDCTENLEGFQQTYTYQLFYDGSATEIQINGEGFASGMTSGCSLSYDSAEWFEDDPNGEFRWQISGEVDYQGAAGGCTLPEDYDWYGVEVLTITESENESVPEDCTYQMEITGQFQG